MSAAVGTAPIVFFGGKGGVGKTTVAAAEALAFADAGLRTLVISTDPAHSLGDAFETGLGDRPREISADLWAAEPDADAAVRRRVEQVTDDAYAALPREIMPAVRRHLAHAAASPGMTESALADQLIDAMERVPGEWDRLVVDSAPTGHLLRMLNLPALLTPWVRGLARQRERVADADRFATGIVGGADEGDDPLLERLHARRRRLEGAARRLREDAVVRLVLIPRRMVLAETERAADQLAQGGFRLGPAVINQVPAEPDVEVLAAAHRRFAATGAVELPLSGAEPTGFAPLRALAAALAEPAGPR
ncbi:arsenite-transporting ATPase [Spinactinospora alkalitolerans]|uniref:Arsenite-transporting ATPase n=1 Tax=Spinactinospora alkalitolerans TaxID=687207 RepID=A0A852TV23_9ACTN|nr:ArsA family ATPase [Spinactinospora alkalitolerans]NYE48306.1 arsenite-transporting ATPase [Spinactinospora alkalitolerans]